MPADRRQTRAHRSCRSRSCHRCRRESGCHPRIATRWPVRSCGQGDELSPASPCRRSPHNRAPGRRDIARNYGRVRNHCSAGFVEIGKRRPAIPSAHVFAGSGKAGTLAKGLEQRVFIQREIGGVVGVELLPQRDPPEERPRHSQTGEAEARLQAGSLQERSLCVCSRASLRRAQCRFSKMSCGMETLRFTDAG